ncbi:MAG: diaminopimelate epimerase [Gammaproteobacteria bacterium]|nr:diaminopimelate epimerase [Gammaproteobacteria bacterium]
MADLVPFSKMHGLGNDFVVFDAVSRPIPLTPALIRRIADRHFGIGCDQILVVEPGREPGVDFGYRIFNADGGEVEQCGNGARCFARFVRDRGLTDKDEICVRTRAGLMTLTLKSGGHVLVNMGSVELRPGNVPFCAEMQQIVYTLPLEEREVGVTVLALGNPHAVQVVADIDAAPVLAEGPRIERHPWFPRGVNAGYMQIVDRGHVRVRVYERGAGETLACGSGACAAVVAGRLRQLLDERVVVDLRGGRLIVQWDGQGPVWMEGPAEPVYEGLVDLYGWHGQTTE